MYYKQIEKRLIFEIIVKPVQYVTDYIGSMLNIPFLLFSGMFNKNLLIEVSYLLHLYTLIYEMV